MTPTDFRSPVCLVKGAYLVFVEASNMAGEPAGFYCLAYRGESEYLIAARAADACRTYGLDREFYINL